MEGAEGYVVVEGRLYRVEQLGSDVNTEDITDRVSGDLEEVLE